ncbi:hypothetical protein D9M73_146080 [compost metagenome]
MRLEPAVGFGFKRNDRHRLGARPISEIAGAAALRLDQADDAVRQIIFDIGQAQNVLPDKTGRASIAAADHEIDFRDGDARKRKVRGDGNPC